MGLGFGIGIGCGIGLGLGLGFGLGDQRALAKRNTRASIGVKMWMTVDTFAYRQH